MRIAMKTLITIAALLLPACAKEKESPAPADAVQTSTQQTSTTQTSTDPNQISGTFAGQVKVGQPVSMFNYVGAESGDFAPMRFTSDSEVGKKFLTVCGDDDECEFTGVIRWLDEPPPPDASAIGEILSVESVRRLP